MSQVPGARQQRYAKLFAELACSGVYRLPPDNLVQRSMLLDAATANAYGVFRVDLTRVRNKQGLLKAIAKAMAFPDSFGNNWDALADSLGDLSWHAAAGWLVILEHSERLSDCAPEDFDSALHILSAAADEWRERGKAFWCLVDAARDGLDHLPAP